VLDLIKAKTNLSTQTAIKHVSGELSKCVDEIKERLLTTCAHIETFIDFPEEDIELFKDESVTSEFKGVIKRIETLIDTYSNGEIIKEGVHTVIVGAPNVGKSSLLNTFLKRDRAIVSEYPGTTRDALEELIEIKGTLFRIVDTAGIMQSPQHTLDCLSIKKTEEHYKEGDLILFVIDGSRPFNEEDRMIYESIKDKNCIIVVNKNDLPKCVDEKDFRMLREDKKDIINVSVVLKKGISSLEEAMVNVVWKGSYELKDVLVMRLRHKKALEESLRCLMRAFELFTKQEPVELVAYEMQQGIKAIRELIGEVYSGDILNKIFSEFCIGK
ncbi:MAG: GTP-binding protein, partial [Candidatus Heimdallarchaeota archaeon]|nr:GTP-binding protein [Candidatus Heimdallarchaeota archaeon]